MKIAFFIPDFLGGGAQHMIINMANEFSQRHHQVELLVLHTEGHFKSLIFPDVRVVDLGKSRAFFALPALVKYMMHGKPDIFLSAMPHLNLLSLLARLISFQGKTAVIITERNFFSLNLKKGWALKNKIMIAMVRLLYPLADSIIGISEGVAKDIGRYIPGSQEKIIWIHNPVITGETLALLNQTISDPCFADAATPVIITSGRLVEQKDHKTLLFAFAQLRQERSARLLILGDGPLLHNLQEQARMLGIENDVTFKGFVNNPLAYMQQSTLFVMSSAWEGFCNVIVEALLCGLPVVSTDCPSGPAEILENGKFGFLTPVGDSGSLAKAMSFALTQNNNPEKQKKRAMDFTAGKICDSYENVFEKILKRPT